MKKKIIVLLVILAVACLLGTGFPDYTTTKITGHETHKGMYLVFTDHGTFKNEDNWGLLKWDSSDLQGKAMALKDEEVIIYKTGWRNSFFSMYENILSIKTTTKGE